MNFLKNLLLEEDGPTAVEYAVMLAMLIIVCIAVVGQIGNTTKGLFDPNGSLSGAMTSSGSGS